MSNLANKRKDLVDSYSSWTSNFTEFTQDIGGSTDVFCVKFNDSSIGANAYFSVVLPTPVETQYGKVETVTINIEAPAGGLKIDQVLALGEVQAILNSIEFKTADAA